MGRMSPRSHARDDATIALRELILAGERYRIAVAAHLDLTVNESRAISYLLARGPMGQTELSGALGLTTSSTTTLLDRLEQREMVRRVPDPDDRRRSYVELPESGVRRIREVRNWMPHAFDAIDAGDLPVVAAWLSTIATSLQAVTAEIDESPGSGTGRRKRH